MNKEAQSLTRCIWVLFGLPKRNREVKEYQFPVPSNFLFLWPTHSHFFLSLSLFIFSTFSEVGYPYSPRLQYHNFKVPHILALEHVLVIFWVFDHRQRVMCEIWPNRFIHSWEGGCELRKEIRDRRYVSGGLPMNTVTKSLKLNIQSLYAPVKGGSTRHPWYKE